MELEKTIAQNRNEWLVYAYNVLKMSFEEISKQVGLAKSTVQNYIRYKYSNLLDKAKKIFNKFFANLDATIQKQFKLTMLIY